MLARVSNPHDALVSALAFHPKLLLVVSASFDTKFKLWEADETVAALPNADAAEATPPSWGCRSVGYYRSVVGPRPS